MKRLIFLFAILAIVVGSATVAPTQAQGRYEDNCYWEYTGVSHTWWGNTYYEQRMICCPVYPDGYQDDCLETNIVRTTTIAP